MKTAFWWLAVACCLTVGSAQAQEKPAQEAKSESPTEVEKRLLRALDQPVRNFEFFEAPLTEVVLLLSENHGIRFTIDRSEFERAGRSTDLPITEQARGMSLRSALNVMLRNYDLAWGIADECVLITTPEGEGRFVRPGVYDVRDLVSEKTAQADLDDLMHAITATIAPDSWRRRGRMQSDVAETEFYDPTKFGAIASSRAAKSLVVRHLPRVHQEIDALLTKLRETHKRPM